MFSNDKYVMTAANAERSIYDEHTDGATSQFETRALSKNVIAGSLFFKDDTHREYGVFPIKSPFPFVEPKLLDRDQQISIGMQDAITITPSVHANVGFSADHFNGLQGEFYNSSLTGFLPFVCLSSPANTSVAGCTLHAWNYNPQAALSAQVGKSGSLFFTFANRGRFPMLKDIYSAGLGSALPNPNLKAEHSQNWNMGYSHLLFARTLLQFELFRSNLHDAIESVAVTDPGNPNANLTPPPGALCPSSSNGFCSQMVNIGIEVHEGVEFKVRTAPIPRLTFNAGYSYLNRTIAYDFSNNPTVSRVRTSIVVLPPLPRNKFIGTATVRAIHNMTGMLSVRYESGLTLQDTTYATTSPLSHPYGDAFATADLGAIVPVYKQATVQIGVKNLLDRNYFYVAGFPEAGRNWFLNMRYQF
jgi:iron complex outermembrane receptor protein